MRVNRQSKSREDRAHRLWPYIPGTPTGRCRTGQVALTQFAATPIKMSLTAQRNRLDHLDHTPSFLGVLRVGMDVERCLDQLPHRKTDVPTEYPPAILDGNCESRNFPAQGPLLCGRSRASNGVPPWPRAGSPRSTPPWTCAPTQPPCAFCDSRSFSS